MLKSLSLALLLSLSFCLYPVDSHCQEWAYIGHSKMPGESNFYIFTLAKKGPGPDELLITQKHVFSIPQKLGKGSTYNSVLISRSLYCNEKLISTDKAVFSNGIGSVVGRYENKNSTKLFEKIDSGKEIDLFLIKKYCTGEQLKK